MPDGDRTLSPSAARRQLGVMLRELRERTGLRLEDAGDHIERSTATLSRLENGKSVPRLVDIRALLELYLGSKGDEASQDERDRVMLLAADSRKEEWFDPFRDVITGDMTQEHMLRYVEWETDADEVLTYEASVVPGLLQTRGYAEAVADLFYPDSTALQRKRFVDFRMARQGVLRRRPHPLVLRVTLREVALRRVVGGLDVMHEQLKKLEAEVGNGLPNVELRIVPDDLVVPAALRGPFTVMRLPDESERDGHGLVYLEGAGGGEYLQNAAAVERYRRDFSTLWAESLPKQRSLDLIKEVTASIAT
jgi:transcriptional regulator with XRE-family HTH domain